MKRRRMLRLAVYLLAATVSTWPLVLHPTSRLAALHGPGDPYLYVWVLGWDLQTITTSPSALVDGRILDANIFHPARQTLAYTDHLIPQALVLWPVYFVSRDPILCYNVLLLFSLVASALAMHVFARAVVGHERAAYLAGLAWGFGPYHFSQLAHLQLQGLYLLPLTFLYLHKSIAGCRRRHAVAVGALAALQAATSIYYGLIGAMGLAAGGLALLVGVGRWRSLPHLRTLTLAAAIGMGLVAPIVWPYWQVQQREGFARTLVEASRHAAAPMSYLSVPPVNAIYGRTRLLPEAPDEERGLFPGFVVIALAAYGLVRARRAGSAPLGLAMAALVALGFVLSLGPEGVKPLYATLFRVVFGFHAIRAPARFAVLVTFGLSTLAALGARELTRAARAAPPHRHWLPVACAVAMAIEYANAPIPYAAAPPRRTPAGQWLARAPEPGAVLYLPLDLDAGNTPYMVQSLEHRRPIVNGYSGQRPGFFSSLVDALSPLPDAESLWTLHELEVRFLVSGAPLATATWPLVERARLAAPDGTRAYIYELRWTPDLEARLEAAAAPPPPDPGPAPFRPGEVAEYDILWAAAAGAVPAGRAILSVGAAPEASNAAYRFMATGETAGWMARIFEARDRFETIADAKLLPLAHERHLREGRRRLDRTVRFDHVRRLVAISGQDGADAISLPMPAAARDALTAFYYARAIELAPGRERQLPINDVGRNLTLVLKPAAVESIEHDGVSTLALRVEPQIVQRIARRQSARILVWLSTDARRIPLVVEVEAGFGRVRAVLRRYRPG